MQRHPNRGKRQAITQTYFLIHDLRLDFASKLLRATGYLALVKNALKHADISSTIRYAHVLDEDVREGLEILKVESYSAEMNKSRVSRD